MLRANIETGIINYGEWMDADEKSICIQKSAPVKTLDEICHHLHNTRTGSLKDYVLSQVLIIITYVSI